MYKSTHVLDCYKICLQILGGLTEVFKVTQGNTEPGLTLNTCSKLAILACGPLGNFERPIFSNIGAVDKKLKFWWLKN